MKATLIYTWDTWADAKRLEQCKTLKKGCVIDNGKNIRFIFDGEKSDVFNDVHILKDAGFSIQGIDYDEDD